MSRDVTLDEPCLRLVRDNKTGAELVALAGIPNEAVSADARRLRGRSCRRSGKRADGGPGHAVPRVWCWTKKRYDSDPLLRAELEWLVARNSRDLDRAHRALKKLEEARKTYESNQSPRRN